MWSCDEWQGSFSLFVTKKIRKRKKLKRDIKDRSKHWGIGKKEERRSKARERIGDLLPTLMHKQTALLQGVMPDIRLYLRLTRRTSKIE